MRNIEIEYVKIGNLKPFAGNPRKIDDETLKRLTRSLRDFGMVDPIIARRSDNMVIGGHQRLVAAKAEKIKEIPVVYIEFPDDKAAMLNVALNQITGEWDWPKLGDLFQEFDTGDIDLEMSGFGLDEIGDLMSGLDEKEPAAAAEPPDIPGYISFIVTDNERSEIETGLDKEEGENRTEQLLCLIRK